MSEGGSNTLFLAIGFLKWKKSKEDPRTYRAPLILYPIRLKRKSALSKVKMVAHEDEPRFNLTLLELLFQDFDLKIPGLEGDLPEDENGIDVIGIWNRVRVAVKDIPGFEVVTDTAIGTFSFSKYLMWKDLADRREELKANAVVKHLMERGEETFQSQVSYPDENQLDSVVDPAELFTPLPADSSQLAAVIASAKGCNFVLDGPPGTGKSQTIANMIVHNLAIGKRVLFVAEKMAALDVVYRRLEAKGLSDFCLEVHSHKTSKTEILKQLDQAWNARGNLSQNEWQKKTSQLRDLRDQLNEVCKLLHIRHTNGLTLHQAIGRVVRDLTPATPRLSWASQTSHSSEQWEQMRETTHLMDIHLPGKLSAPTEFSIIRQSEWSNHWQDSILGQTSTLPSLIDKLLSACSDLISICQLNIAIDYPTNIKQVHQLVSNMLETYQENLSFSFNPDAQQKLQAAKSFLDLLQRYRQLETRLSTPYRPEAARAINTEQFTSLWKKAGEKFWFFSTLAQKKVAKQLSEAGGTQSRPNVAFDLPILKELRDILKQIDDLSPSLSNFPGYAGVNSNHKTIQKTINLSESLSQKIANLSKNTDELIQLKSAVKKLVVDGNELLSPDGAIALALQHSQSAMEEYVTAYTSFSSMCKLDDDENLPLKKIKEVCLAITSNKTKLKAWCAWQRTRQSAIHLNLAPIVKGVENGSIAQNQCEETFLTAYCQWFAAEVIDSNSILREFSASEQMDRIERFRHIDEEVSELTIEYTRTVLSGELPAKSQVSRRDGFGILKHELQKKRRHKPLRQLTSEMGDAFTKLAPCMLMSPLSIAQYLPPDQQLFDLVIFDEASQITPWDAVGSIARGKQVVIAGDPRQKPPTNFFQRSATEVEFDGNVEGDLESILDECLAVGIPRHSLNWHYRSRHESLITFSNHQYYGGKLVTFPAPETRESAVSWRHIDGIYAKGAGRTNQAEAKAMVAEVIKRLKDPSFTNAHKSIGIITLNTDQQRLVENLLDKERQTHPDIEPFFSDDLEEPVFVKNLETVQGDERDVILLGIGYGPTEPGAKTMSMNFGPLNRDGGERRLNVALTRSKEEMIIFTSFAPSMIDLNRTSARAVRDLKLFIEFADRGPIAITSAIQGSQGGYESPFEEAVAGRLQEKGWQVVPQVGVSRFRIDLGIVHPDRPGDFLVGVECDGATYHSSATARDRDKTRSAVLEGLGWSLLRVWSTDWFIDPEGETKRLHEKLTEQ